MTNGCSLAQLSERSCQACVLAERPGERGRTRGAYATAGGSEQRALEQPCVGRRVGSHAPPPPRGRPSARIPCTNIKGSVTNPEKVYRKTFPSSPVCFIADAKKKGEQKGKRAAWSLLAGLKSRVKIGIGFSAQSSELFWKGSLQWWSVLFWLRRDAFR